MKCTTGNAGRPPLSRKLCLLIEPIGLIPVLLKNTRKKQRKTVYKPVAICLMNIPSGLKRSILWFQQSATRMLSWRSVQTPRGPWNWPRSPPSAPKLRRNSPLKQAGSNTYNFCLSYYRWRFEKLMLRMTSSPAPYISLHCSLRRLIQQCCGGNRRQHSEAPSVCFLPSLAFQTELLIFQCLCQNAGKFNNFWFGCSFMYKSCFPHISLQCDRNALYKVIFRIRKTFS